MGAPLRRLAEGYSDELFTSSHVGFLPFPAPLRDFGLRFFLINYVFLILCGAELWDDRYKPFCYPVFYAGWTSAGETGLLSAYQWSGLLSIEISISVVVSFLPGTNLDGHKRYYLAASLNQNFSCFLHD